MRKYYTGPFTRSSDHSKNFSFTILLIFLHDLDKAYLFAIVSTMHVVYKNDKVILLLLLLVLGF